MKCELFLLEVKIQNTKYCSVNISPDWSLCLQLTIVSIRHFFTHLKFGDIQLITMLFNIMNLYDVTQGS